MGRLARSDSRGPAPPSKEASRLTLDQVPITTLRGVGPRVAERLKGLGISSVQDLLFHLPYRYQDRTRVVAMRELGPGREVLVAGRINDTQVRLGRRRSLLVHISDDTGSVTLRFFYFSAALQASLAPGGRVKCYGEVRRGPSGLEMVHPELTLLAETEPPTPDDTLAPVYHTTDGLHQLSLRRLTDEALALLDEHATEDLLPESLRARFGLWPLASSLRLIHRPPADSPVDSLLDGRHPAQQRLALEELLAHHLSLKLLRAGVERHRAPCLATENVLVERFMTTLPFTLTAAQQRVGREIARDLSVPHPMQRLLQGDVGSGKTVVGAMAVLQAIESGYQAALMAPTELLAEQHWQTFFDWLSPLGIEVQWLSGKLSPRERREATRRIGADEPLLAVGTHALFQSGVEFARLGLVVIDEQHRFGVHQRLALKRKGERDGVWPHQLIMTATPIPRTLAMTAYADLDVSMLDQMPAGRRPVETVALPDSRRDEVVARIRAACLDGRQAYWVCTLIDESEALQAQAAGDTSVALTGQLPELNIGLIHGRMKPAEKQVVMADFKAGRVQLLVATTVIEVGMDVPRASLMIIENAERLGLAQLHQLRGRIGRGTEASSCVLMYRPPLSRLARERLDILRRSADGFDIAQRDLELRGPGEVLGTRQTGLPQLRIADLTRDHGLLPSVHAAGAELMRDYPDHVRPLVRRWLANAVNYGDV